MDNKTKGKWDGWRDALTTPEVAEMEAFVKKTKRGSRIKMLTAFGVGGTIGSVATGYIAWQIFKRLLGGFLRA